MMTKGEAFVLWCEICGYDPAEERSFVLYLEANREDRDSFLADLHSTKDEPPPTAPPRIR